MPDFTLLNEHTRRASRRSIVEDELYRLVVSVTKSCQLQSEVLPVTIYRQPQAGASVIIIGSVTYTLMTRPAIEAPIALIEPRTDIFNYELKQAIGFVLTPNLEQTRNVFLAERRGLAIDLIGGMWPGTESNCRHEDFQSSALPTELPGQKLGIFLKSWRESRSCACVWRVRKARLLFLGDKSRITSPALFDLHVRAL